MVRRRLVLFGLLAECVGLALGGAVSPPAPWQRDGAGEIAWTTTQAAPMTTPAAMLPELRRQLNPLDQIVTLSSSLSAANLANQRLSTSLSSILASASAAQASASAAQASASAAASAAEASASAAQASAIASAASVTSAASLAVSSAQASASSAVASAASLASSASRSASEAMSAASAAMADATAVRAQADSQVSLAQGSAISVTQAAIAVVGAIIGSALLTLLGFFVYLRYRRVKVKEQEEDVAAQEMANAALNRAVMSYIGKGEYPPGSAGYPSYAGSARSFYGGERGVGAMSRPTTADKSAIPGMGVFSLQLKDPTKQPGQILESVEEDQPTGGKWDEKRASNWPFRKEAEDTK